MRTKLIPVAMVLYGALAACGGDSSSSAPEDVAEELGCDPFETEETEELFVRELYICDGTRVYFFNSSDARDSWREIAEQVGGVVMEEGDTWIQVKGV